MTDDPTKRGPQVRTRVSLEQERLALIAGIIHHVDVGWLTVVRRRGQFAHMP
jgi:hypothetical protein